MARRKSRNTDLPPAEPAPHPGDALPPEARVRLGTNRLNHVVWQGNTGVCRIAYSPNGRYLLAIGYQDNEASLWELPGGRIDADESARDAAWRELAEEAGCAPGELEWLGVVEVDDGQRHFGAVAATAAVARAGPRIKAKCRQREERNQREGTTVGQANV